MRIQRVDVWEFVRAGFAPHALVYSLEQHDVHQLAKHQPRVKLCRYGFPPVPFAHLHFELALPPTRPRAALFAARFRISVEPSPRFERADDQAFLRLTAQDPGKAEIVRAAPECEIDEEKGRAEEGVVPEEEKEEGLGDEGEECEPGERRAMESRQEGGDKGDGAGDAKDWKLVVREREI